MGVGGQSTFPKGMQFLDSIFGLLTGLGIDYPRQLEAERLAREAQGQAISRAGEAGGTIPMPCRRLGRGTGARWATGSTPGRAGPRMPSTSGMKGGVSAAVCPASRTPTSSPGIARVCPRRLAGPRRTLRAEGRPDGERGPATAAGHRLCHADWAADVGGGSGNPGQPAWSLRRDVAGVLGPDRRGSGRRGRHQDTLAQGVSNQIAGAVSGVRTDRDRTLAEFEASWQGPRDQRYAAAKQAITQQFDAAACWPARSDAGPAQHADCTELTEAYGDVNALRSSQAQAQAGALGDLGRAEADLLRSAGTSMSDVLGFISNANKTYADAGTQVYDSINKVYAEGANLRSNAEGAIAGMRAEALRMDEAPGRPTATSSGTSSMRNWPTGRRPRGLSLT